jgi:hypothetical protein
MLNTYVTDAKPFLKPLHINFDWTTQPKPIFFLFLSTRFCIKWK